MRRQQRLNRVIGIAAAVLLTLGGGILWQALSGHRSESRIKLDDIGDIRIERTGQPGLLLRNVDDDWRIVQPWPLPANRQRIEPLLSALTMGGKGYAPREVDMAATGLAKPDVVLHIDDTRIEIGATDASGARRYARRHGRIVLIDDWLTSLIDGGVTAMARLTPFDESLSGVTVSMLTSDSVDRPDNTRAPAAASADEPFAHVRLNDWQALAARQIVKWPIDDDATERWQATLEASLDDAKPRTFRLVQTGRYTALHPRGSGFAYVFANEDLPCPNFPKSKPPVAASNPGC